MTTPTRILLWGFEPHIVGSLLERLPAERSGLAIRHSLSSEVLRQVVTESTFDLIVLDRSLPPKIFSELSLALMYLGERMPDVILAGERDEPDVSKNEEDSSAVVASLEDLLRFLCPARRPLEREDTGWRPWLTRDGRACATWVDSLAEGVSLNELILDADGRAVDYYIHCVNRAFSRQTGIDHRQIQDRRARSLHKRTKPPFLPLFTQVVSKGQSVCFDALCLFTHRHRRIHVSSPAAGWFVCLLSETTDKRRLDERRNESEENDTARPPVTGRPPLQPPQDPLHEPYSAFAWQQALFEGSRDAILITDAQSRFVAVNQAACQLTGYSKDQLVQMQIPDLHDEEDLNAYRSYHGRILAGESQATEAAVRRQDGSRVLVEFSNRRFAVSGETYMHTVARDVTEQVAARELLAEKEHRFRLLAENATDVISLYSVEGGCRYASPACRTVFGYEPEELIGRSAYHFVHPDDVENLSSAHQKILAEDVSASSVFRALCGSGSYVWMESTGRALRNEETGEVESVLTVTRDVAARKEAEAALQESEARFRAVFERAAIGIALVDAEGRLVDVNPRFASLLGRDRRELSGRSFTEWLHPSDVDDEARQVEEQFSGSIDAYRSERRFIRADGKVVWGRLTASLIGNLEGRGIGIRLVEDVTEQREIEQALRESEERLNLALDAANEAQWEVHLPEGTIAFSPQYSRMLGHGNRPRTLAAFLRVVHPEDRHLVSGVLRSRDEVRTTNRGLEFRIRDQAGEWRWMMARGKVAYEDSDGQPKRLIGTLLDISEAKRAAEARRTMELQLQQSQKLEALGVLAGGIAHDFNNILGVIFGYTEMALAELPGSEPVRQDLEQVLTGARRAQELVRQILSFSRRDSQEQRSLELNSLVKETLKLLRASVPSTIEILSEIPDDIVTVLADPTQIHQVVMNLCTNAAHAMRETGGTLKISLNRADLKQEDLAFCPEMRPGIYVDLVIADSGHGMSAEVRERIFEPFFTTKPHGSGTGLGLSVAYGIIRSCGGGTQVFSSPGKGTVFHVYLPRLVTRGERATEATPVSLPRGREAILWVDDEQGLVHAAQQALSKLGYVVTAQTDSRQALQTFLDRPDAFDLVVTDQTMPGLTGSELAVSCLSRRPDLPVILCTGYSDLITAEKAADLGVRKFVMKPLRVHEIAQIVRETLDGTRSLAPVATLPCVRPDSSGDGPATP